jgi:signal peptidase II
MFYWIAVLAALADQGTKLAVRALMQVGETVTIKEGVLQFIYYLNSGAARSSFQGYGRAFGVFGVIFIVWVLVQRRKGGLREGLLGAGMAFFVSGAAGNTIDRLLFGQVTDFLAFGSGRGILNVADVAINIGAVLVLAHAALAAWSSLKARSHRKA